MKFVKSLLAGTGAVALAGLIVALLVPKAAEAIAATAVQVVNTPANPVLVQQAATRPFVQSCEVKAAVNFCNLAPLVPSGYTFVVQHSNFLGVVGNPRADLLIWDFVTQGAGIRTYQVAAASVPNDDYTINDSEVSWYIDSQTEPLVNSLLPTNGISASLTGYLISN